MEETTCVDGCFIVTDMSEALTEQVRVEGTVSSRLFESVCGGIHGLSGSSESTGGQHLNLLHMVNLGAGVDHLLLCLEEFLGEMAEL